MDNTRKFTSSCTNCRTRNESLYSQYTLMSNPYYGMTYDSIFYPFHMGLMSSDTFAPSLDLYPKCNHQPFSKTLFFLACRENKIPLSHSFSLKIVVVYLNINNHYLWQYGQLGFLQDLQTPCNYMFQFPRVVDLPQNTMHFCHDNKLKLARFNTSSSC
jgi:hypothetical protein